MTAQSTAAKPLAALRDDLLLTRGEPDSDAAPTWRIYDPLRHAYHGIDVATAAILTAWPLASTAADLGARASEMLGRLVTEQEVEQLRQYLAQHGLLGVDEDSWRQAAATVQKQSLLLRLVHSYLFFKVPLVAPQAWLARSAPTVEPLYRLPAQLMIAALGVIGLYFVSRQWATFFDDARGLMSAAGIAQVTVTLFVVKILHEFGHAFTAHRAGCRVPVMGVAVMMGVPILYTDVTDAWRLKDRRKRFAIDAAGVAVELGVACLATFLWVFLPEGLPRQVAFLLATTSWTMSIAINLNPFMRFDGYYILSDLLGVENLQSRAFALGTWSLREHLFGIGALPPERLPQRLHVSLIAYAWATWISRVIMFTGIALAIYAYFFKALGVALFAFEIGYFIVKPLWHEVAHWWTIRGDIKRGTRIVRTVLIAAVALAVFIVPWSRQVAIPAIIEADATVPIHAPRAGRIVSAIARAGQMMTAGDVIATLEAPELDHELRTVSAQLAVVQTRLDRSLADQIDRSERIVLLTTHATLTAKHAGLQRERRELVLRAPRDGVVVEVNSRFQAGRWIGAKEPLALLRGSRARVLHGYVPEGANWRIAADAPAVFVPEAANAASVAAVVRSVAPAAVTTIDVLDLQSTHGGPIAVVADDKRRAVPTLAHYRVDATATGQAEADGTMRLRGTLHITGTAESFASATLKRVLKVLVREATLQ